MREIKVGDFFERKYIPTLEDGIRFADVSTDKNPIHTDEEAAAQTRFKKPIAHGMLAGGYISAILGNDFPGPGTVYLSQNLQFRRPVFYDEPIWVYVEVVEIIPEKNRVKLITNCYDKDRNILVLGEALVLVEQNL